MCRLRRWRWSPPPSARSPPPAAAMLCCQLAPAPPSVPCQIPCSTLQGRAPTRDARVMCGLCSPDSAFLPPGVPPRMQQLVPGAGAAQPGSSGQHSPPGRLDQCTCCLPCNEGSGRKWADWGAGREAASAQRARSLVERPPPRPTSQRHAGCLARSPGGELCLETAKFSRRGHS